jgi:hypothetical protein
VISLQPLAAPFTFNWPVVMGEPEATDTVTVAVAVPGLDVLPAGAVTVLGVTVMVKPLGM